jgi:hypothetical protein
MYICEYTFPVGRAAHFDHVINVQKRNDTRLFSIRYSLYEEKKESKHVKYYVLEEVGA